MAAETLQMSRLANGEAENSLHEQNDQIRRQHPKERCANLGSDGTAAGPCCEENGGEVTDVIRVGGVWEIFSVFCNYYANLTYQKKIIMQIFFRWVFL